MQAKFKLWFPRFQSAVSLIILFLSLAIVISCGGSDDETQLPINKTVTTTFGDVRGATADSDSVWVWKGIPYAKAPVGALRWKAPVDPIAWTGVREATAACSECLQQVYDSHWFSINSFVGSEDCLFVDIYAPRTGATKLPVYVYVHGGANNFGSAKQYDGTALAKRGNMIVVYVQYRLNAMGFLTHSALRTSGTDYDKSGNYGLLDIQKALSWVQNNIEAFGGDKTKVVVGGQSAGAHNIMSLITSPMDALFRGAFIQSVPGTGTMPLATLAESETWTNTTIKGLLMRDFSVDATTAGNMLAGMSPAQIEAFLRSQPAELIVRCRRDGTGADGTGAMASHSAIRDGMVVRDAIWTDSIAAGNYHKVPIVNGGTRFEWKTFAPLYGTVVKLYSTNTIPSGSYSWFQLWNVIGVLPPALTADQVLPLQADKDFYATLVDQKSRHWRYYGVDSINRALKTNDSTNVVYSYNFQWAGGGDPAQVMTDFAAYFGAGHSMDIAFFQGNTVDAWGISFTTVNKTGRDALQGAMMDYLISFVKTLNPNPAGSTLLAWQPWDNAAGTTKQITFNANLTNYVMALSTNEVDITALNLEILASKGVDPNKWAAYAVNGL